MKHALTLATLATTLSVFAQPALQYGNWPTAALNFSAYTVVDPGSASEPTDGANQTWDFSSVTFAPFGTAELRPAAGTPYAATYSAANWAFINTPTGMAAEHVYMAVSATGVEDVATHVPLASNPYTDYERILEFTTSLGGSWMDTYASPDHTGTQTWTYGGHGTLLTDLGNFSDQLKTQNGDGDLVIWNAAPLFPRLIANSSGAYLHVASTVGIVESPALVVLRVAPNPVADMLQVTGADPAAYWSITDTQGRTLLKREGGGPAAQNINVSSLVSGNYLLIVEGAPGRRTVKFNKL